MLKVALDERQVGIWPGARGREKGSSKRAYGALLLVGCVAHCVCHIVCASEFFSVSVDCSYYCLVSDQLLWKDGRLRCCCATYA
jgi:hypothetical protein